MAQMKGQCNKSLKTLLSRGIEDLHDDGFEGSVDEDAIFRAVFFGPKSGGTSKRCLVTGAINFETENKFKDVPFRSNSEYSVMTSQDDSGPEEFVLSRNEPGFGIKRRKVSVEELEHSDYQEKVVNSLTPSKEVDQCSCQLGPIITCRLVESSGRGVKSSCYLLKGRVGDRDVAKCWFCSPDASFVTVNGVNKVNGSPGSQESHVIEVRSGCIEDGRQFTIEGSDFRHKKPKVKSAIEPSKLYRIRPDDEISDSSIETNIDDYESCGKVPICNKPKSKLKNRKRKNERKRNSHDLLTSAMLKNRSTKRNSRVGNGSRKYRSRKGGCRLLPRTGGPTDVDGMRSGLCVTTVLSLLIDFGSVNLNETVKYLDLTDGSVVKHGSVTRDGILCGCCEEVLSVSKFKIHAGFTPNHLGSNLFMESGKSFTSCQLEAWSTEYKLREGATRTIRVEEIDPNDDSCGLCGDGGELICCDNCPSTFHQLCLCVQELPEGDWYCSMCSCWSCGNVIGNTEASILGLRKCLQCKHKYHMECVGESESENGLAPSTWFCRESCKEVHSGLESWVGLTNSISDGFSWTVLRCISGDEKGGSGERFVAQMAECNMKLAVAATIMEESFLPMVDPRTGIDMIPHVLYNRGSEYGRLNYEGFYTVVLEKDDMLLCIASVRIHGIEVAEIPLIATCSKYRRQGMCRRLMNAIEELLKSLKVEKLVLSAIPSLVETWMGGFGFEPLEPEEKKRLGKTNMMVFPGTVWLKKRMYQNHDEDNNLVKQVSKLLSEERPSRFVGNWPEMVSPMSENRNMVMVQTNDE